MAKVLVVEDSATERDHLRGVLAGAGHEVLVAASGKDGVDMARRHRPDLILMDIVMDDMDGYHATRSIRDDAEIGGTPVVVVSSKNQKADKVWAQLQGATAFLVKPVTAEQVLTQVEQVVSGAVRR